MKQIIFIFMAILLATGIASAQNKAVISADETSFDFGTIKEANGNVSHTFTTGVYMIYWNIVKILCLWEQEMPV